MYTIWGVFGAEPGFREADWVMRVFAVSIPAAIAAVLIWQLLVYLGADPRRSFLATLCMAFGSIFFGYATIFYPYLPGIASSLGALWLILRPPGGALNYQISLFVGMLCGFALICDLIFGLLIASFCVVFLMRIAVEAGGLESGVLGDLTSSTYNARTALLNSLVAALAGTFMLAIFFGYTYAIFGSVTIPYEYYHLDDVRIGMQKGLMGVTTPDSAALYFLTIHPLRGILFWTPIVIPAVIGCIRGLYFPGPRRIVGALGLYAFVAYLLFNASFFMWWSGWAMGPRYMLPMFAAMPLGLAELCRADTPRWIWRLVLGSGVLSVLLCMPLSLLNPQVPQFYPNPFMWKLEVGTPINAPQFWSLHRFYTLGWLWPKAGGFNLIRLFSISAAILFPLVLTIRALRWLPNRS